MNRVVRSCSALLFVCSLLTLLCHSAGAGLLDGTPNPNLRRLYRLRRSDGTVRMYTVNPTERLQLLGAGALPEPVLGQVLVAPAPGSVPLYHFTLADGNGIL